MARNALKNIGGLPCAFREASLQWESVGVWDARVSIPGFCKSIPNIRNLSEIQKTIVRILPLLYCLPEKIVFILKIICQFRGILLAIFSDF